MRTLQAYNADSAWWNFCVTGNYVSQFYNFAIKAIRDMQQNLQTEFNQDVKDVESTVKKMLEGAKDSSTDGNNRLIIFELWCPVVLFCFVCHLTCMCSFEL